MRSFFTGLIIVVVLLAALIGISPYFIGQRVETNLKKELAAASQNSPYATLSVENYQRHWFTSTATIEVAIRPSQATMKPFSFELPVNIKHGPIMVLPQGLKFGLGAFLINQQTQQFNGHIGAIMTFSGQSTPFGQVKTMNIHKDGGQLSLQNLILQPTSKKEVLNIEKLSIQTPASEKTKPILIRLNQIKLHLDGAMSNIAKEWLGKGDFTIQSMSATEIGGDANKQDVHMGQLTLGFNSILTNNNTKNNVSINFMVQSFQAGKKIIKPINLSYGIYGLDVKASSAINQLIKDQPDITQDPAKLMPSLFNLLGQGLTFKINKFYIGLPTSIASSPINLSATVTLKPSDIGQQAEKLGKTLQFTQFDPKLYIMPLLSLTRYLDVNIDATLPISLVKTTLKSRYKNSLSRLAANNQSVAETPSSLTEKGYQYLVDNKMLVTGQQDGAANINITFKNSKLLVNDHEPALDLPQPSNTANTKKAGSTMPHTDPQPAN